MVRIASALASVFCLATAPAWAQNDGVKKSGDGVGNVFKGIGQQIEKASGSSSSAPKKDAKKSDAKKADAKKG